MNLRRHSSRQSGFTLSTRKLGMNYNLAGMYRDAEKGSTKEVKEPYEPQHSVQSYTRNLHIIQMV